MYSDPCPQTPPQEKDETSLIEMVAALQHRVDKLESENSDLKSGHLNLKSEFKGFRAWVIVGTISSVIAAITKFIPDQTSHVPIVPQIHTPAPAPNTATGGNVTIGMEGTVTGDTRREYLTTEDVAKKERVSQRTVTAWIQEGRIDPKPVQSNRAWQIAVDYRILPLTADAEI